MRVNMVPRDGGNQFHGQFFGNFAGESFTSDNCDSPGFVIGVAQPCTRSNLTGSTTFNPATRSPTSTSIQKIWDFNPVDRRADQARQALVPLHLPALGHREDHGRQLSPTRTLAVRLRARHRRSPASTMATSCSNAARVSVGGQQQRQDLGLPRQPDGSIAITGASPPPSRPRRRRSR